MYNYSQYLSFGIGMMVEMKEKNEAKLREIEEEYWKSASYPRKKKKRVRKSLILDYNIFSWAKEMYNF